MFSKVKMPQSRTTKVITLSLGRTLTGLAGIISAAVLSRILTQHDYATYRQTILAYAFAAPLLTLALPQALYYFIPQNKGKERQVLVENLALLGFMGVLFTGFLLLGGSNLLAWRFHNPDLAKTLKLLAPYPLFMLPAGAIGACLVIRNRISSLTIFNVLSRLITLLLIIGACIFFRKPGPIVITEVLAAILVFVPCMWLMFDSCPGTVKRFDWRRITEMVKYSVPLGFSGMLGLITLQLDKIIVSSMCATEEFAIYANGAIEIPLIGIITGSIATVILADMTIMCQQENHDQALMLFHKAALRSASLLLPAMCFLMITADQFIITVYSIKYIKSVLPFRLYLLILPVRIVVYGSAIMALGMTRFILIRSIFDLIINAILSVIFVWVFGYIGAVIATIFTLYLWTVPFNLRIISKGFNIRVISVIPLRDLAIVLGCSFLFIPLIFLHYLLSNIHTAFHFIFSGFSYWPPTLLLLYKMDYIPFPKKLATIMPNYLKPNRGKHGTNF
jgi:O-antigen/teichoic acid export membrane protein